MEREYGIGRVPADVDPVEEALAELEAVRLQPPPRITPQTPHCAVCGRPCNLLMTSSRGSICPDCYDDEGYF